MKSDLSLTEGQLTPVLFRNSALESWALLPRAGDVAQIALRPLFTLDSDVPNQGLDDDLVQALALLLRATTKSGVQRLGHVPNRVLHEGILRRKPKQTPPLIRSHY